MKLSFGERQPFRIWFDYLKTCLNNELDRKIDRKFYKDWHLSSVKNQKFDTWYKSHEHLFVDTTTQMKISTGTKSSNSRNKNKKYYMRKNKKNKSNNIISKRK